MCEKWKPESPRSLERLMQEGGFISTLQYGPLEEWTSAEDVIEVLCSYGSIERYTILSKTARENGLLEKEIIEVIAVSDPREGPIVTLTSMSDHYSVGWRFLEGAHSSWPRQPPRFFFIFTTA